MNDDLISRQAAIDAISTWDKFGVDERGRIVRWRDGLEPYVKLRDVITAIFNTPFAQPEPHWIPVTERLPEEDTEVFVYLFGDRPYIAWWYHGKWYTDNFEVEPNEEPIAWMPLPEPYKGVTK